MSMTFDLYDLDIVKPGVAMEIKISYSIPPFHHSSQSLFWLFPHCLLLVLTGSVIQDMMLLAVYHYTL